jgi:nucleoid-associated protein YgaU
VLLGSLGCTSSDGAPKPSDGVLVIEVGGEQPSLREALLAHGVTVAPARSLRPEAPAPVSTGEEPPAERDESPNAAPPEPGAKPVTPPEAESYVVVKLGRGQTLIHLAKKHLGDGNRFRDILALNGWTEADARRLRENQDVKIPRPAKTQEPQDGR